MAEPTLSMEYDDFCKEIAYYLGYGRTAYASLSSDEQAEVDAIIQSGLRQFYFPPPLSRAEPAHEWRFFKPVRTVVAWASITGTVSGSASYDGGTGLSTITATASVFYSTVPGQTFVFDTSSTEYTIDSYVSGTQIKVTGDASGEAADDTFTITSNGNYQMPDDFGGMEGDLTFGEDEGWVTIPLVGEGQIRSLRQTESGTGRPEFAALRPKPMDATVGLRWELLLHPSCDSTYNLSYRTNVFPAKLDTTNKYPLGGAAHSETVLESCLAIAELRGNDERGIHQAKFLERLAASIQYDMQANSSQFLGYMDRRQRFVNRIKRSRKNSYLLPG